MYIILLSGGKGKRMWPISSSTHPKQYIKMVDNPLSDSSNEPVSMLQRIWFQLKKTGLHKNTIITTNISQSAIIKEQIESSVKIAIEPDSRDTYPSILLSVSYLKEHLNALNEDFVCVLPVDSYTDNSFFQSIIKLEELLKTTHSQVALIGATPKTPSSKYGYILLNEDMGEYFKVSSFKEKPSKLQAKKLISDGCLWNCGVACFKIGTILKHAEKKNIPMDYETLCKIYNILPKNSFDKEFLETAKDIIALKFHKNWLDIGTWCGISERISTKNIGNAFQHKSCENTTIINKLPQQIITIGCKNLIVVASEEGILITEKESSSKLKECLRLDTNTE